MTLHDAPFVRDGSESDELNDVLDAVAAGRRPPADSLPPTLVATVRLVHRLSDERVAPRLHHAESERIWEDLMQAHTASPASPAFPFLAPGNYPHDAPHSAIPEAQARHREARLRLLGGASAANTLQVPVGIGRRRNGTLRQGWNRHGWPIVELLGVAALIIGLVSVMVGGLNGGDQSGGRPAVIPPLANVGTATPDTGSNGVAALPDPGQTGVMPGPGPAGNPELVWRVPIQDVTSDLFVSDGTIVRARFSDQIPADFPATINPWTIEALSARAGTPIWESTIEASGVQIGGIWQGTIVLVATGEYGPIRIGNEQIGEQGQGFVLGMDLMSGALQWSTRVTDDSAVPASVFSPTLANDHLFVSTSQGQLYSINPTFGAIDWSAAIGDQTVRQAALQSFSKPAVEDNVVVVYSWATGSAYAFDTVSGRQNWEFELSADPAEGYSRISINGPVMTGGSVYFTSADYGSANSTGAQSLIAVSAKSGKLTWTTELDSIDLSTGSRPYGVGQPYIAGDHVLVSIAGADGFGLTAFSTETGDQVWKHSFGDSLFSQLSIVDDTAYVARVEGELTGIDTQTGDELWSLKTGGELRRAPYVVDGTVYQAGQDGQLYALGDAGSAGATPGAAANISGLASCDVAPRAPASDVFAKAAKQTPAATLVEPAPLAGSDGTTSDFLMPATIAWDDLPVGSPADADVATAIQQTVDGVTTCTRAGDQAQVAAYYTDDFFSRPYNLNAGGPVGGYFTSSEIPVMSGDLRVLDDGRVGMIATEGLISREIGQNEARLYIFAEQPDGQWLIDEDVIVNNSGEAPQG
jgi:outer membrane protein assembly factor BamB